MASTRINWVRFTKRTEDPKLAYIERWLDDLGIQHRRNGYSFHAPILEVPEPDLDRAWKLLSEQVDGRCFDDIDDDDPMFL